MIMCEDVFILMIVMRDSAVILKDNWIRIFSLSGVKKLTWFTEGSWALFNGSENWQVYQRLKGVSFQGNYGSASLEVLQNGLAS